MADTLIELAGRCEKATGPDREIDADIADPLPVCANLNPRDTRGHVLEHVPAYTASLDAAMTLVPEGWHSSIFTTEGATLRGSAAVRDRDGGPSFTSSAGTAALALCAAALRARAAMKVAA
jgi:hypothetical protein